MNRKECIFLIRLDKFISERTEFSRSELKALAKKGKISVDGTAVRSADAKIDPEKQSVTVCGKTVRAEKFRYILLNKPQGYVCSTDEKDGETVIGLVPPELRTKNLFPAGRLDKDSLGALLITDDGALAHRMLSPSNHISKIYIVKLANGFKSEYINKFKNGLVLSSGEQCLPARLRPVENCDKLAFTELFEGKYHQIKRMFAAVGDHVEVLMRISLGGLVLPDKLGIGECMELLHKDVESLFQKTDFDDFCSRFSVDFSAFHINK